MCIKKDLINENIKETTESYNSNCLEIYKLYVEMADRISSRRQSANSYFLTINTVIIGLVGYLQLGSDKKSLMFYSLVGLCGMLLCFVWSKIINSYRQLNSGKFKVVHQIESILPLKPYDAEWTALGKGENKKLYLPFTHIENKIPWIFFIIHLVVFIRTIPFCKIINLIK